jgi:P27 family predicted phage terminase small subunit
MKRGRKKKPKKKDDLEVFISQDYKLAVPRGYPPKTRAKLKESAKFLNDNCISKICDQAAWERYCQLVYLADDAFNVLFKDGGTVKDERGIVRKHPAGQVHKDSSAAALRFEEQFGLTPLSRIRVRCKNSMRLSISF